MRARLERKTESVCVLVRERASLCGRKRVYVVCEKETEKERERERER